MVLAVKLPSDLSYVDAAYNVLKSHGQPMNYRDLIQEIMAAKSFGGEVPGKVIAQIHTEINLDSRFIHKGQGIWGLRAWGQKNGRVVSLKKVREAKGERRKAAEDEEDEVLDIEDELAAEEEYVARQRDEDYFHGDSDNDEYAVQAGDGDGWD